MNKIKLYHLVVTESKKVLGAERGMELRIWGVGETAAVTK